MARKAFYCFHYKPDCQRAAQVRSIGVIEGNQPVSDNKWESITKGGDTAIKKWIAEQLHGKSCAVVLIGSNTAGRKWINYEIIEAWEAGKGVVGVYVHGLKDLTQKQSTKGANPFSKLDFGDKKFSSIVKAYDPPYTNSKSVYNHIATHLATWVEEAIAIRNKY